jgi:hypothetical protein
MRIWPALVSICCSTANAQVVATATVSQTLVAHSSTTGSNQILPGPVPAGGISLQSPGSSSTRARTSFGPLGGPLGYPLPPNAVGWGFGVELNGFSSWNFPATSSVSGRVVLTFQSPQPVRGVLFLAPSFSEYPAFTSITGDITVDRDGDGIPDYFLRSQSSTVEIPLTIDASPVAIAVDSSLAATLVNPSSTGRSATAYAQWWVVFVPGTYALETYATGCFPLWVQRHPATSSRLAPTLECMSTGADPVLVFFLLGLSEQNVPMSLPPHCPLLVGSHSFMQPTGTSRSSGGTQMWLSLPHYEIPSGLQFRCQAVWLDALGSVFTTDAVRTL